MQITIVLLPGLDGTGDLFAPLLSQLSRAFIPQVVAYPNNSATYEEHVSIVRASLPKKGRYILVAESYSGPVAVTIAAQQPHGLAGLVLCASFLRSPRAMLTRIRHVLRVAPPLRMPASVVMPFLLGSYATPSLRQLVSSSIRKVLPRTLLVRLSNIAQADVSNSARAIKVPCLYIRARSDRLVPRAAGEAVRKAIASAEVIDLAGPHLLLQSNATEAVTEIERFARRVLPHQRSD